MSQKYKIAIIVTWFGPLPSYFDAWLTSAEANTDIDFLLFFDHEIRSCADNIKVHLTTMEDEIARISRNLNESITIKNSYKFCDLRAFFGLGYQEYLKDYDFWGYCDIDLVFGNIRHFITDEKLEKYDRFYQYGHLSIFRNVDRINRLYDLPGGIYSRDEIFRGIAKTTPEEYFGINRICMKNHIRWYTKSDFADFCIWYPDRLDIEHGVKNYSEQIFVWHEGRAYQLYKENNEIKENEFVYMHWQKRKPNIQGSINSESYLVITPKGIFAQENPPGVDLFQYNKDISANIRKNDKKTYFKKKWMEFLKSNLPTKKIWIRQKLTKRRDGSPTYK